MSHEEIKKKNKSDDYDFEEEDVHSLEHKRKRSPLERETPKKENFEGYEEGVNKSYQTIELVCEELPRSVTESEVRDFFSKWESSITSITINQRDRNSMAIIRFNNCEDTCSAFEVLRDMNFQKKKDNLKFQKN